MRRWLARLRRPPHGEPGHERSIREPDQRAKALARLVEAVAAGGDHDRALRLPNKAMALTGHITQGGWREEALDRIAQAMTLVVAMLALRR
jgi:hypothetical protein